MRKLAIAMALSSTVLATPALARDGAWYIGGEFGGMIVEDMDLDFGATNNAVTLDSDYGYDGDILVGYDMGAFRLEVEGGYKHARLDKIDNSIQLPFSSFVGSSNIGGGSTSGWSGMVNALLDFGPEDGISGFVGGGAG